MSDGNEEVVLEQDTPALEHDEPQIEGGENDEAIDSGETAEELEDVEFGGKTYKLPKDIKPALMMQADYTRKTQEVAEARRAIEAERQGIEQQRQANFEHVRDVGRVVAINEQLSAYEKLDWQRLEAEDPFKAQSAFRDYSLLKNRRDQEVARIQQREHERSSETQQTFAKRYEETNAKLASEIKDWNSVAPKLAEFARSNGLSDEEIRTVAVNAPMVKLLHRAWLGEQVVAQQKAKAAQVKAAQTPTPEPLRQVAKGRGSATSGLDDRLSAEEWVKRRNEQVRKK